MWSKKRDLEVSFIFPYVYERDLRVSKIICIFVCMKIKIVAVIIHSVASRCGQ